MSKTKYDQRFYADQAPGSLVSARAVIGVLHQVFHPSSVVDVGCGVGAWLKAWSELGVHDITGIDGLYVSSRQLMIPAESFLTMDLVSPTAVSRRFDLVQSLEVAEHLPDRSARGFVSFLCSLGPVVLFAAAIPGQGGHHHINEQWPEYWNQHFQGEGYQVLDVLRDCIWENPEIDCWYRQNALLYVKSEERDLIDQLMTLKRLCKSSRLSRVHPALWLASQERIPGVKELLRLTPRSLMQTLKRRQRINRRD